MTTQDWVLVAMPFIGGLIGWMTNMLAVRMLFRPREPVRILGMTWIGLLPKRRRQLAEKIAETVETQLLSSADITALIEDPEVQAEMVGVLEGKLDEFVQRMFEKLPAMVQAFVPRETLVGLRNSVLDEIARNIPELARTLAERVEERVDVRKMVIERIDGFDIQRLERIVLDIASSELRHIELLGGVLGFLIGCAQAGLMFAVR